ncbi:HTH-type transcriptional regulator LrpC [Nymphon striatum]|nr:HTH-type transcriptional regulator LrpC [Nymphon striatum]
MVERRRRRLGSALLRSAPRRVISKLYARLGGETLWIQRLTMLKEQRALWFRKFAASDLGEKIGLTPPAVAERVRKLEDAGIISGFRAVVDYEALGFPLLCIIRPMSTVGIDPKLAAIPHVIEASRVTGSDSHVIRARVRSTKEIEDVLGGVWEDAETITNIVTSRPVPRRPMNLAAVNAGREQ